MNEQKRAKWDGLFKDGAKYRDLNEVFIQDLLDAFTASAGARPSSVVDLGCGTGDTLAKFAALGIPVMGVDISGIALEQAKEKLGTNGKMQLIQHDLDDIEVLKLEAPKGSLWICKLVLAFVLDKRAFLRGVSGLMSSGDFLLVMTPVLRDGITYVKEDKPGIALPVSEAEKLLTDEFGSFTVFSNEYPAERGRVVSYLVRKA